MDLFHPAFEPHLNTICRFFCLLKKILSSGSILYSGSGYKEGVLLSYLWNFGKKDVMKVVFVPQEMLKG